MKSIIKEKLDLNNKKTIITEDPIRVSDVKPSIAPKRPNKNEFNGANAIAQDFNEAKHSRLKAYDMLKSKNKQISKEEINKLSKMNINEEQLNPTVYQGLCFEGDPNFYGKSKDDVVVNNDRSDLSLLNQFERYYKNKITPGERESDLQREGNGMTNDKTHSSKNNLYQVSLTYTLGINHKNESNQNFNCQTICFHKQEKWTAYLNKNMIIIENFSEETDNHKKQQILVDSKYSLDVIKISDNGKLLMAYSTNTNVNDNDFRIDKQVQTPQILFYSYNAINEEKFKLINKSQIKHMRISDCEISPQNNLCLVISSNKPEETFISVLDFHHNEILMTTVLNLEYFLIKWNPFLVNLEFSTLCPKLFTFWRINSGDVSLQYQHGDFNRDLIDTSREIYFTCAEFTPPLSINSLILLLVGVSNGEIWGINTKTNSLDVKYASELGTTFITKSKIKNIICSLKYISIISDNTIKYFKLPYLKEIKYDELNLFANKEEELKLDSEIISLDIDRMTSEGLAFTKKGSLSLINYEEKMSVRLVSFNMTEITLVKVVNKDFQFYSLRKIDFDSLNLEEIYPEVREDQYFLVTVHKGGAVKVWSIPEYTLSINFEVPTEEVTCLDNTPNDLKLCVAYNTGVIRFFDIRTETILGKFKSISGQPFKHLRFLPDGIFLFAIDMNNTVFLIKVEKFQPLLIQTHQLFNVSNDIVEFKLSPVESYNKFLIDIQNVYLQVYNRKFTNILKNSSYDSCVPVFYVQDKFNPDEYFKSNAKDNLGISAGNNNESFKYEFSPNLDEKSLIYVLSQGRKTVLIRNYETHVIIKVIKFDIPPINFGFSPNSAYVTYLFKDRIQINQLGSETGIKVSGLGESIINQSNNILSNVRNLNISLNGKILVIHSENTVFFYKIKFI